ncbi:hypothetical protein Huta_2015 [Halorhabdus utahensis DSM 12940]|uniref:Uncharacterized protein n=1 Tax=Halorhabdus utahensis (strain DSM 12940 / JCM 11049 / AX-2) TaxID=519442 RepID=C7NTJ3_HALUD|nr:hypothetical protein Huta_2015 [Halorhabdus utahensis DSM 12940]
MDKNEPEKRADKGPDAAYRKRVRDLISKHKDTLDLLE